MQRKLLLSVTTLIISVLPAMPTHALVTESGEFWTMEEVAAVSEDAKQEIISSCEEEDYSCKESLFSQIINRGGIYGALQYYDRAPLLISGINPSAGTISLYFRDEYLMGFVQGITNKLTLEELYMARFDISRPDHVFFVRVQTGEGIKDGTYLALVETEEKNGKNWLESNKETTFKLINDDFHQGVEEVFWSYYRTSEKGFYESSGGLGPCMSYLDPSVENRECKLVFGQDKMIYYPLESNEPETATQPESTEEVVMESTPVPEPSSPEEPVSNPEPPISNQPKTITKPTEQTIPKAPNTGIPSEENSTLEMSWWLKLLIIIASTLLVWWILPTKYEKTRKKSKKMQKRG